jgi:hypothetical protein
MRLLMRWLFRNCWPSAWRVLMNPANMLARQRRDAARPQGDASCRVIPLGYGDQQHGDVPGHQHGSITLCRSRSSATEHWAARTRRTIVGTPLHAIHCFILSRWLSRRKRYQANAGDHADASGSAVARRYYRTRFNGRLMYSQWAIPATILTIIVWAAVSAVDRSSAEGSFGVP